MTVLSLAPGSLFAGRYRVVRCIAHGGMGAVYEVIHLETERRRALKVMLPTVVQSQDMRDRFRLEARVTASIESEFLVDVSDAGIDDATQMPFLVMEFLRGEELSKRLKRMGKLEFQEVVTYLHQAAMALDKTHQASIVHRDLKPGNLFLTERDDGSPRIKVLDFGIAKLVADSTTQGGATQSLGTPLYMAPEQFKSGQRVSPASDIYSLGMLAYHLLVGKAYWAEEAAQNVFTIIAAAVNGPQESAQSRAQRAGVRLPATFDQWFFKATSVHPSERFATAGEAVRALALALGMQTPGRRATLFPESLPPATPPPITDAAPPSRGAPMITPVTPLPPMSQPPPSARPPISAPRSGEPPTFATPTHVNALTSGSSPGFSPIPDVIPPPSAPSGPQGAFPPYGSPIQPSGSLTGSGVSHTGMYASLERPKASRVPILVAAGLGVGITVALLIAVLPKGGAAPDDGAREPGAAAATSPTESNTSPVAPAAPTPEPPTPIVAPAETAAPVQSSAPSSAPAPTSSAAAEAAPTSKPKTDAAGKPSRPSTKTPPKPSVVYSPD